MVTRPSGRCGIQRIAPRGAHADGSTLRSDCPPKNASKTSDDSTELLGKRTQAKDLTVVGIQKMQAGRADTKQGSPQIPFYRVLWVQVLLAMVAAVVLGYLRPERAVAMKPLGD